MRIHNIRVAHIFKTNLLLIPTIMTCGSKMRRYKLSTLLTIWTSLVHEITAIHHMRLSPVILATADTSTRPFRITNHCPVDVYPAIETQAGTGPTFGGYHALPGNTTSFEVSAGWQGRIWARTNCTFNENGTSLNGTGTDACLTGDCGGLLDCQGTVRAL